MPLQLILILIFFSFAPFDIEFASILLVAPLAQSTNTLNSLSDLLAISISLTAATSLLLLLQHFL